MNTNSQKPLLAAPLRVDLVEGIRDRSGYIYELESIRGIAFLLVFLFHTWGISGLQTQVLPSLPLGYIIAGNTGVTLFFVLSGFLLSLPWLRYSIDQGRTKPEILAYYKARLLRIIPLYYVILGIAWVFTGDTTTIVRAAAFLFVGFDAFPFSVVWWTLVTEFQFYLLLPLVMALWISGRVGRIAVGGLLVAWLCAYVLLVLQNQDPTVVNNFILTKSIFARLPAFLFGIVAAAFYLRARQWPWLLKPSGATRYSTLMLVCMVLYALGMTLQRVALLGGREAEQYWHLHHSLEALLWALLIVSLLLCTFPGRAVLVNRHLAVIGKLSYSLYLLHLPVLFYLIYPIREHHGDESYAASFWLYLLPAVALGISLVLSRISYQLVERPFLRLKRKVSLPPDDLHPEQEQNHRNKRE